MRGGVSISTSRYYKCQSVEVAGLLFSAIPEDIEWVKAGELPYVDLGSLEAYMINTTPEIRMMQEQSMRDWARFT